MVGWCVEETLGPHQRPAGGTVLDAENPQEVRLVGRSGQLGLQV